MRDFEELTRQLREGRTLSQDEIADAVELLASPENSPETKAEFLTALTAKGETTREIGGFAVALRNRAVPVRPAAIMLLKLELAGPHLKPATCLLVLLATVDCCVTTCYRLDKKNSHAF